MKKLYLIFWVLLMVIPLLANQRFIVGEVFTAITCPTCPPARSALRTMADNKDNIPYLIPLIWQYDTNTSPNVHQRAAMYSVAGIPHARFGGTVRIVGTGGFGNHLQAYTSAYNEAVLIESPIDMNIHFLTDGNILTAIANIEVLKDITTTNNRLIYILSYDWGADQAPGNYCGSVVRYHEEFYSLLSVGQSGEFRHTFTLNPAWDIRRLNLVVMVQTFEGDRFIHQARMRAGEYQSVRRMVLMK